MKVTPKIPLGETAIRADALSVSDCFIDGGNLFMVIELDDDPKVLDLSDGSQSDYGDECMVIPVDCTIAWTKKASKKKKK